MKKGFTLLELIIVLIIVGILATLGFTQYTRMVEKMRGAEAREILGDLRKKAAAFRLENGTVAGLVATDLDVTADPGDIPSACAPSHYFSYDIVGVMDGARVVITATRCGAGGKTPEATGTTAGQTLVLMSNLVTGVDAWTGSGPWD